MTCSNRKIQVQLSKELHETFNRLNKITVSNTVANQFQDMQKAIAMSMDEVVFNATKALQSSLAIE